MSKIPLISDDIVEADYINEYKALKTQFKQRGVTFLREILLMRIWKNAPFTFPGIEEEVPKIASILFLNSIEIVCWELLLHATSHAEREMETPQLYLFTALLSKISLNKGVEVFEAQLSRWITDFRSDFQN